MCSFYASLQRNRNILKLIKFLSRFLIFISMESLFFFFYRGLHGVNESKFNSSVTVFARCCHFCSFSPHITSWNWTNYSLTFNNGGISSLTIYGFLWNCTCLCYCSRFQGCLSLFCGLAAALSLRCVLVILILATRGAALQILHAVFVTEGQQWSVMVEIFVSCCNLRKHWCQQYCASGITGECLLQKNTS